MLQGCDFTVLIYMSAHIIKTVLQTKRQWHCADKLEQCLFPSIWSALKSIYMEIRNNLCMLLILPGLSMAWIVTMKRNQDKSTLKLSLKLRCRRVERHNSKVIPQPLFKLTSPKSVLPTVAEQASFSTRAWGKMTLLQNGTAEDNLLPDLYHLHPDFHTNKTKHLENSLS